MTDNGDKNKEGIRQIMTELNIRSMDFRGNKNLREKFYQAARIKTKQIDIKNSQPLSDSRIQKIGRQILKEDKPSV